MVERGSGRANLVGHKSHLLTRFGKPIDLTSNFLIPTKPRGLGDSIFEHKLKFLGEPTGHKSRGLGDSIFEHKLKFLGEPTGHKSRGLEDSIFEHKPRFLGEPTGHKFKGLKDSKLQDAGM